MRKRIVALLCMFTLGMLMIAAEVSAEAVTEPAEESAAEAVTEAAEEPAAEPTTEAAEESTAEPATEAAEEAAAEPATEAAEEAAAEVVTEAAEEAAAEVVTEAVEELAAEVVTEAAEESATEKESEKESEKAADTIPCWEADSPAMASIIAYVNDVSDESSPNYVPAAERIAIFDFDGTLYGELFPTYFDQSMLMYRLLHDDTYEAQAEDKEFAAALEYALLNHEPEPDSDKSTAQMAAESFKGYTVEEYRAYVRAFKDHPVVGFEGMTYGEGFYKPMAGLIQYLTEHGFVVFISSGAERTLLRELVDGTLDEWIPPYHIIGSTFSLTAPGQGDTAGRSYTYSPKDQVIMEGNMTFKNLKMNKVVTIIDEIGADPILAFGNSSGDFSMAQYTVQNGGKAYMLLCDDTERDYGDLEKAEKFAGECRELGFETVSMHDEFTTIYGEDVVKTEDVALEPAA